MVIGIVTISIVMFYFVTNSIAQISFKSVTIGKQIWMAENLNVDRFRNGDIIPEMKTFEEWKIAGKNRQPAWSYYDYNSDNGKKYGKLYNWYAVKDVRGLAPEGWHIPTLVELETLGYAVRNNSNVLKEIGQGIGNGKGTNTSGFSALLAGHHYLKSGFYGLGIDGFFWSSTEWKLQTSEPTANILTFTSKNNTVYYINARTENGFSVRCIKD
jgi:uncharacterized protein (TIGR02145 family)